MKRLTQHILSLLRLYDTVALPGLGFFRLTYIPARLDMENSLFLPSRFDLDFDPSSEANDGLLVSSYIRKEQIGRAEARGMMESDLANLCATLEIRGAADFPGIGTLFLREGDMEFHPHLAFNLELPAISVAKEQEVESPSPQEEISEIDNPTSFDDETPTEVEVKIPEGYRYHNPEYFYIPVHKRLAKLAACFLLVVIVGVAAFIPVGTHQKPAAPKSAAAIVPFTAVEEPLSLPAADSVDSTKEVGAILPASDTTRVVYPGDEVANRYYAIVAAFKTRKEVDKFLAGNTKGRFEVVDNGRFHLISASSASEKDQLDSQMPLIRVEYPDAWIHFDRK